MESQKKVKWKVHFTKIPKFLRVPDWGWLLLEFTFLQSHAIHAVHGIEKRPSWQSRSHIL